jgi:6-pyruvoyltetrahydropterin/6-carboxytetrahydropterin synthase
VHPSPRLAHTDGRRQGLRTHTPCLTEPMQFDLSQSFYFEAAHTLRRHVDAEPSRRIHGHTYLAEVHVVGQPDPASGMLVDLALLRAAVARVREQLDHRLLDEVPNLGPPTLENLCAFIATQMQDPRWNLSQVLVRRDASGDACRLRLGALA